MNVPDIMLAMLIILIIAVSFLNPGGLPVAAAMVGGILILRFGGPFARDYYISAHSGKVGRKAQQARTDEGGNSDNGGLR